MPDLNEWTSHFLPLINLSCDEDREESDETDDGTYIEYRRLFWNLVTSLN